MLRGNIFCFFFRQCATHRSGGMATVSLLGLASEQPPPTKKNNPEVRSIEGKSYVISKTSTLKLSALNLCTHAIIGRRALLLCGGSVGYPEFLYGRWPVWNTACGGRVMSGSGDSFWPRRDPRGGCSSLVPIISPWNR